VSKHARILKKQGGKEMCLEIIRQELLDDAVTLLKKVDSFTLVVESYPCLDWLKDFEDIIGRYKTLLQRSSLKETIEETSDG
jgi:hypothetical protein